MIPLKHLNPPIFLGSVVIKEFIVTAADQASVLLKARGLMFLAVPHPVCPMDIEPLDIAEITDINPRAKGIGVVTAYDVFIVDRGKVKAFKGWPTAYDKGSTTFPNSRTYPPLR